MRRFWAPYPDTLMPSKSVLSYYVLNVSRVLRRPCRALSFLLAAAMHAFGQALAALVAGALALALADGWRRSGPLREGGPIADRAFLLSVVGLTVLLVKGLAGVYATYVQARLAGEVGGMLRLDLLDSLLSCHRLRHPRHDDHGSRGRPAAAPIARAVAALTERVRDVEVGLDSGVLGGARAAAQLAPLAALLVALSARMAVLAAVVLTAFGWALGKVRSGYQEATKRAARERERLLEAADDSVRHADLWVSYGAEAQARANVRTLGEAIAVSAARLQARAAALSGANEVLGGVALVAAVAASRAGWLGAVADGGTVLAFVIAFFLAYRPLRELSDARLATARAQGAYEELRQFIDAAAGDGEPSRAIDAPGATPRAWPLSRLELRELRLPRGACGPLSVRIEAGSVAVLIGPTGVGKTTLLRTLLGLERVARGEILFDGEPIGEAAAGPRARPFAWVPQDAPLVADTLAANVALGAPGADARVELDAFGAAHLTQSLRDARLGAGGRSVSGGERQWIALARAIATRLPVLLLDEPTSGLDPEAQRRVLAAIARLRGQRTVLLVTHRPEPLTIADVVVRLDPRVERAA
jgi:ABC-type multidrug transport system fused ATPase/permease subunit